MLPKRRIIQKAKYEQKFGLLSKQSATFNNLGIALRRQSDKQLEQIRKQEELEKNLTQQLQVLEKEAAAKAPMLEKERRRVAELTVQAAQQKDKADRTALRCDQLAAMLKTKTEAVEQEAEAKRRLQEQVDMLKRKLDAYGSRDSPADSVLKKQLEEYKLLLKCQSCNNRFKSHVLNKCMHTFCKECIDDMYNSRQRKCPACGVAFSQQDIRQVYL
ncbi:hypothetical protein BC831DRAFT_476333 [Entophlyctis helioformis]|nr:hypothetical protein BC831DRAFT_476333 [Entophlyctis helioformis]